MSNPVEPQSVQENISSSSMETHAGTSNMRVNTNDPESSLLGMMMNFNPLSAIGNLMSLMSNVDRFRWTLNNGEVVYGMYTQAYIDEFNRKYDQATANGADITTDIGNFAAYQRGESVVGNYVAHYIQNLPDAPSDYQTPATFALSGVMPTYNAAQQYADPWGNCYSTTASRVNKGYEDLYDTTPIDYTQNTNGTFTSTDYRIASSQAGVPNFGYGVGGALAHGGEAALVTDSDVWSGNLKPGAALQIWHSTDQDNITQGGGHSQIFIRYTYDANEAIDGMEVFDNSGAIETISRSDYEGSKTVRAGNLLDP